MIGTIITLLLTSGLAGWCFVCAVLGAKASTHDGWRKWVPVIGFVAGGSSIAYSGIRLAMQ